MRFCKILSACFSYSWTILRILVVCKIAYKRIRSGLSDEKQLATLRVLVRRLAIIEKRLLMLGIDPPRVSPEQWKRATEPISKMKETQCER